MTPALHYEPSTIEGYVTKGLLPYGRVAPQRLVASCHPDKRIKSMVSARRRASSLNYFFRVVPEGFLLRFFLESNGLGQETIP